MRTDMQRVRATLARHAGCPASALHPGHRLESDLDLTPLELVLIAVEIEQDVGVSIPADGLASIQTVGELMGYFSRALSRARRSGAFRSVA
jgi:acyl carrier protein